MKKVIIGTVITIIIGLLVFFAINYFSKNDLESAIEQYDDQDYTESIIILNHLGKSFRF